MSEERTSAREIVRIVLKAVALAMAVASIVLGFLDVADAESQITMLSIGLFTLSVTALDKE